MSLANSKLLDKYLLLQEAITRGGEEALRQTWEEYARQQIINANVPRDQMEDFLDWLGSREIAKNKQRGEPVKYYGKRHAAGLAVWGLDKAYMKEIYQEFLNDKIANQDNPGVAGLFEGAQFGDERDEVLATRFDPERIIEMWSAYIKTRMDLIDMPADQLDGFLDWLARNIHETHRLTRAEQQRIETYGRVYAAGLAIWSKSNDTLRKMFDEYKHRKAVNGIANTNNPGVAGLFEGWIEPRELERKYAYAQVAVGDSGIPANRSQDFLKWLGFQSRKHGAYAEWKDGIDRLDIKTIIADAGFYIHDELVCDPDYNHTKGGNRPVLHKVVRAYYKKYKNELLQQKTLNKNNPGVPSTFEERCRQISESYMDPALSYNAMLALTLLKRVNIPEKGRAGFLKWLEGHKDFQHLSLSARKESGLELIGLAVREWSNNTKTVDMTDADYVKNQNKIVLGLWDEYQKYNDALQQDNPGISGVFEAMEFNTAYYTQFARVIVNRLNIPRDIQPTFFNWIKKEPKIGKFCPSFPCTNPGAYALGFFTSASTDRSRHRRREEDDIVLNAYKAFRKEYKALHKDNPGISPEF